MRLEPAGFGTPRGAGGTGSPQGSRIGPSTVTSGLAGALLHGGALDVPALPGLVYFPPPCPLRNAWSWSQGPRYPSCDFLRLVMCQNCKSPLDNLQTKHLVR